MKAARSAPGRVRALDYVAAVTVKAGRGLSRSAESPCRTAGSSSAGYGGRRCAWRTGMGAIRPGPPRGSVRETSGR